MAANARMRSKAPRGRMTTIGLDRCAVEAYATVHHSGTEPGVLLLVDQQGLDAGMRARADLLGQADLKVARPTEKNKGAQPLARLR